MSSLIWATRRQTNGSLNNVNFMSLLQPPYRLKSELVMFRESFKVALRMALSTAARQSPSISAPLKALD